MPILDDALAIRASEWLNARAEVLRTVTFGDEVEINFTLDQIRGAVTAKEIKKLLPKDFWPHTNKQPSIYVISVNDAKAASEITKAFPTKKDRDFAGPRLNPEVNSSSTLYVGSSEDVRSRLKQHLFRAPKKTYALNLQRWCPKGMGSVKVRVQPILDNGDRQVRQDLEDILWQTMRPIFGKPGGR